jgi:ligand-binding sensor domain-containing protein
LAKFEPNAPFEKKFVVYRPERPDGRSIHVLYESRSGQLWCGTEGGLFRLRALDALGRQWQFEAVPLVPKSGRPAADRRVISLFEDVHGDLWVGTVNALYRRRRDGEVSEYKLKPQEGGDFLWNSVVEDGEGRLWAGTGSGLWRILPDGSGDYRFQPVFVPRKRLIVWCILKESKGKLWLGTSGGLIEWTPDGSHLRRPYTYNEENGLTNSDISALCKDREGNLWLGSAGGGAMRLARNGFLTYTAADKASFGRLGSATPTLFRDRAGEVHVAFHHVLNVLRDGRFVEITPAIPRRHSSYLGWGWHQTIVQDKIGEWWISTAEGLVRFPAVPKEALDRTRPKAVYTTRDGLRTDDIFRVFEDSQGGIWIACIGLHDVNGLSRWDRRTGSLRHFTGHTSTTATAFAEDPDGAIWIGYYDGALARFRNGSFAFYGPEDGLTGGGIQALHVDRAGRLWIASLRGLVRVDATSEEHPNFVRFGVSDGLSSNVVLCIAEDQWGRVYLATRTCAGKCT